MWVLPATGPLRFGRLLFQLLDQSVKLTYVVQQPEWTPTPRNVPTPYAPGQLGPGLTPCFVERQTLRVPSDQPTVHIRQGETGRVTYNWRYSHGDWFYERWTFNLAMLGSEPPDLTVFVSRAPTEVLTRLSRLL